MPKYYGNDSMSSTSGDMNPFHSDRSLTEGMTEKAHSSARISRDTNQQYREGTSGTETSQGAQIAEAETIWVRRSKCLVILVLFVAASVVAFATYTITWNEIQHDWHAAYDLHSSEIIEVSRITADNIFSTVHSMSITISSYALGTGAEWPFVTIPHFEARGKELLGLSGAKFASFSPLVREENKVAWEAYSVENQQWIQDGIDFRGDDDTATPIVPFIYRKEDETAVADPGPADPWYGVTWQVAPAPTDSELVNFNALSSSFRRVFRGMVKANGPVLSEVVEFFLDSSDLKGRPQSYLVQPIYDDIGEHGNIVGYVNALLPWDNYFKNLLPTGVNGIMLVLENTCNQMFTFQIQGPKVIYLGEGDLHDPRYDDHELSANFNPHQNLEISEDSVDTLDDFYCFYSLHAYPSDDFLRAHESKRAITHTIAAVLIFVFTSVVFILYDCFVQRRQNKVMVTVTRANGIVSSLFPAQVRDRLMERQSSTGITTSSIAEDYPPAKTKNAVLDKIRNFARSPSAIACESQSKTLQSEPIADLFPDVTVLFADIAGFTAWSSKRDPTQVFKLLEEIYNSFDEIALRLGVFKVETIGDCYLATTGLPEPCDDHAAVMVQFAKDCRINMNQVVKKISEDLGPDTKGLSMRFGIHSGPVTAGVLRGQKSRFQLFGDTVNTAARIESTGQGDKIHLSKETAKLLIDTGKSSWVIPRETQVEAKGKGKLHTYWAVLAEESDLSL